MYLGKREEVRRLAEAVTGEGRRLAEVATAATEEVRRLAEVTAVFGELTFTVLAILSGLAVWIVDWRASSIKAS